MTPNSARIVRMASAFQESCLLFAASDLGIFEALSHGDATSSELAAHLNLNERGTRLLLNACVAVQLIDKHGEHYRNTPDTAAFLVAGKPGDLSAALRYNRDVYSAWGKVADL